MVLSDYNQTIILLETTSMAENGGGLNDDDDDGFTELPSPPSFFFSIANN